MNPVAPAPVSRAVQSAPSSGKTKGKNINARMLDLLSKDKNCYWWSARQFADHLDCTSPTVIDTKAWEQILAFRAISQAERVARSGVLDGGKRRRRK